jgi:hypothetical protein
MSGHKDWVQKNPDNILAENLGLTQIDRWGEGRDHHPESVRLMEFLANHDFKDYKDHFCWKMGGDGDNGEIMMYQMDAYFEMRDLERFKEGGQ